MKRIIALLCLLAMVLPLCACGGGSLTLEETATEVKTEEKKTDAENVKIIGEEGSVIDGDNCYDEVGEELYRGPHAICFFNVKNVDFYGYTIKNSANWAHNMLFCENITVKNVTVEAGHDGFDAAVCKNILSSAKYGSISNFGLSFFKSYILSD